MEEKALRWVWVWEVGFSEPTSWGPLSTVAVWLDRYPDSDSGGLWEPGRHLTDGIESCSLSRGMT